MGAAHDTGDGCFCHQRHLPRMIVPGFADHDPGPGIEGIGRGALRGARRTRRTVTRATPGREPPFARPPGAPFPGVRVTSWHANDRTRVLHRITGQPEPRAVLARAPRDLPCSPRESCSPGEREPRLVTALLAVPMLLIHAISEWPPKPPPLGHGLPPGRLRRLCHGRRPSPARRRGPARAAPVICPGMRPRSAAAGTAVNTARPPRHPGRCHRRDLAVNVQPTGQSSLNPTGPDSSAARALGAFVTAAPGGPLTAGVILPETGNHQAAGPAAGALRRK